MGDPKNKKILRRKRDNLSSFLTSFNTPKAEVTNTPLEIFLEVCNTCNIRCKMCATHGNGWLGSTRFMPKEVYETAYPLFENAIILHPFGFGEPLLHKNFKDIIKLAKSNSVYIDFFTNATLLDEEMARVIVTEGVDRIVVSFDGATKETYEKIHEGAKYEKVVKNLRYLHEMKKRKLRTIPEMSINFIVMQSNFHELPDLLELATSWGLESIELKALVTYEFMSEMEEEKKSYEPERDSPVIERCREIADRNSIKIYSDQFLDSTCEDVHSLSPDELVAYNVKRYIEASPEQPYCREPFRTIYIKSDGRVKPCCFHQDYDFLGNVREKSLSEIWNGDKFIEFRQKIINQEIPKGCIPCIKDYHKPMHDNSEQTLELISRNQFAALSARELMEGLFRNPVERSLWKYLFSNEFRSRARRALK